MPPILRRTLQKLSDRVRNPAANRSFTAWLQRMERPSLDSPPQTLVFNTVRALRGHVHLPSDLLLGHLLARNGHRVVVLVDDGVLEHWDTAQLQRSAWKPLNPMHDTKLRAHYKRQAEQLAAAFAHPGLELRWYSDLLSDGIEQRGDDEIAGYARASTMRFFEQGRYDADDAAQRRYLETSTRNALTSRAVGRAVAEQIHPDVFVTSHALYSTWGPAYREAKRRGIRTRVYALHPYRHGGLIIHDAPGGSLDHQTLDRYLLDAPFDATARAVAEKYIDRRFSHQISDTREYFAPLSDAQGDRVAQLTSTADAYPFTFGLFPNVLWDAIGDHLEGIYDNVIDWIADTVRTIGQQGTQRLVLRLHPAEVTRMRGTIPSYTHIKKAVPEIEDYDNVVVIHPEEDVDSYPLIREAIDVVLVYTGTLGAEAQLLNVPVVPAAAGRFSERFVHQVENIDAYHQVLRDPTMAIANFRSTRDQIIDSLFKYHYYVNEELYYPVGLISPEARLVVDPATLADPAATDQTAMKKTLERLLSSELRP